MMIHPPMLYSGYVAFTVPFVFAIGALVARRLDAEWIKATRRFALIAWALLGFGLLLGAQAQDPHVGLHVALAVEQRRVMALARLERLDVVGELSLQALGCVRPADDQLAPRRAVQQPALLAQLPVLRIQLDCYRIAHFLDSRKTPSFRYVKNFLAISKTSEAIEDYAKAIYALSQDRQGPVLNGEVAERLGVTPATATSMLKRLAGLGFVDYLPYRGVTLTPAGERVALEVIRHHRLIEAYLSEALGMPSDRVHEEAEVLEHYISEELEALIAAKLGEPSHDPHGTPIPGPDLRPPAAEASSR